MPPFVIHIFFKTIYNFTEKLVLQDHVFVRDENKKYVVLCIKPCAYMYGFPVSGVVWVQNNVHKTYQPILYSNDLH